jgi:hypothetical protein
VPDKTPKRQAEDLKDLVVAYAKQETIDPLRHAGRYVAFGVGGALVIGLGVVFLAVGTLRLLQTETGDALDGNWTTATYAIVVAALGIGAGLSAWMARRAPRRERQETR